MVLRQFLGLAPAISALEAIGFLNGFPLGKSKGVGQIAFAGPASGTSQNSRGGENCIVRSPIKFYLLFMGCRVLSGTNSYLFSVGNVILSVGLAYLTWMIRPINSPLLSISFFIGILVCFSCFWMFRLVTTTTLFCHLRMLGVISRIYSSFCLFMSTRPFRTIGRELLFILKSVGGCMIVLDFLSVSKAITPIASFLASLIWIAHNKTTSLQRAALIRHADERQLANIIA